MEQGYGAATRHEATIGQIMYQMGIFCPLFLLVSIILIIWLGILFFRTRPLSDYCAYIAATLYPLLLGFMGASWSLIHFFYDLGNHGISDPAPVSQGLALARDAEEIVLRLCSGSLLTCIFFPLGILLLLIRRPK